MRTKTNPAPCLPGCPTGWVPPGWRAERAEEEEPSDCWEINSASPTPTAPTVHLGPPGKQEHQKEEDNNHPDSESVSRIISCCNSPDKFLSSLSFGQQSSAEVPWVLGEPDSARCIQTVWQWIVWFCPLTSDCHPSPCSSSPPSPVPYTLLPPFLSPHLCCSLFVTIQMFKQRTVTFRFYSLEEN